MSAGSVPRHSTRRRIWRHWNFAFHCPGKLSALLPHRRLCLSRIERRFHWQLVRPSKCSCQRMIVRLRTLATPATYALSADHREIREMRVIDGGAVTEFGIDPRNQAMPDRRPRIALRSIRAICCRLRAELSSDARGFLVARMKRNVTRECLMDCPGLRSRSSRATCCLRTLSGHAPPTHIRSPGNWLACLTQPANRASSSSSSSWMWK